jgi:cell division transport system permease protein
MANIHLKTALDYIRRSPFQALAATFVLSLTFLVTTILIVLAYSSSKVITYFETRPQVIAFLKDKATPEEIATLQNKIVADPRVKDVRYVSKEEALEIYKEATADNPLLSELVSPTIFPASLEFSLKDLSQAEAVIKTLKNESIVDQVGFTASLGTESQLGDVVKRLRTITTYLRVGGGVFAGLLIATSFLVLIIIIGMRMSVRKGEIEILDLIGATPGFIRKPMVLEALIYAISGVFIGWALTFVLVLYLAPSIIAYFGEIPVLPRDTFELAGLFGVILGAELVVGLLLALFGSLLAISRAKQTK